MQHRRNIGFAQAAIAPAIAGSGPAAPFVAAALLAAPFVMKLVTRMVQGCGQSCTLTSDAANQIEAQLIQNLRAYENSGHTQAEQAAALQVFDAYWFTLAEYCGKPEFQSTRAGRACIEDRAAGSCKWKDDSGQCWNWFIGYRDPIANDQNVRPNATPASAAAELFNSLEEGEASRYLIPAAALALILAL